MGSYGKNGDQPQTMRLLKNISNSHLENIIKWIKDHFNHYDYKTLNIMEMEKVYREINNIYIEEYN